MEKKKIIALLGDIGGTNSRLSLVKINKEDREENVEYLITDILSSKSFGNIETLLNEFLGKHKDSELYPKFAVLGIPGPVFNNTATIFANLDWPSVNGEEVAKIFNLKALYFLNDFVVNGYGILSKIEQDKDYIRLNDVEPDKHAPLAMIGAGTGLGHGLIFKNDDSKYYQVFPSEGGHQDFCPRNELQFKYLQYIQNHFKIDHVSVERACAGPSLPIMYKFLSEIEGRKTDEDVYDKEYLTNEEIIKNGLDSRCIICIKVLDLFIDIYASAAANMCLLSLPLGGLYLLGGMSIALEEKLKVKFIDRFYDKGITKKVLQKVPVFLIKNGLIGVKGAEEYAKRKIENID